MGKKHRLKQTDKLKPKVDLVAQGKKKIFNCVEELFSKCITKVSPQKEWDFFVQLYESVEELRKIQNAVVNQDSQNAVDRLSFLSAFISWLGTTGAIWKDIEIFDYGNLQGFGIRATKVIKEDEALVFIPRTAMITHEDILSDSYLKDLIESNEILSQMPNVCLALFLHCESYNPNSKYKPYIDILPRKFNTTLYFTPDDMKFLKGSPVLSTAINHYKSIVRQFCLIYKLFHGVESNHSRVQKISSPARELFTFDSYRRCVSIVSTRQNQIPIRSENQEKKVSEDWKTTLALIPLWDMFNHEPGPVNTVYDTVGDKLVCYSMTRFCTGEQVTICYGSRSNADLLIHNGFVLESNPLEKVFDISLGVSRQDPLHQLKAQLLRRLDCDTQGMFSVAPDHGDFPVSRNLLVFLRVFHMNEDELVACLELNNDDLSIIADRRPRDGDDKVRKFLADRLTLLRRTIERACGGDPRELLESGELSERARLSSRVQADHCDVMEECVGRLLRGIDAVDGK